MKSLIARGIAMLAVLVVPLPYALQADPALHKFQYWGTMKPVDKLDFFNGWTNGFFGARPNGKALLLCLEDLPYNQSIEMIDKYYKDHPEHRSHAIGAAIVEALTVEGGPCEGKNPLR